MHEVSVAQDLVELVTHQLAGHGPLRVVAVRLRLGALSGVASQALRSAYGAATAGTVLEGSALHIEEVKVTAFCPRCAANRELDDVAPLRCPACGSPTPNVTRGRELEVISVEVVDDAANSL